MGRKKKDLSYIKPFCYYCDKVFNNEIILHQHQKAKHFTCQSCKKKFSTANSMCSHISSVHKEHVTKVYNAIQGRDSVDLNIFGMQGVPKHLIEERLMAGVTEYWNKIREQQAKQQQQNKPKKEKYSKNYGGTQNEQIKSNTINQLDEIKPREILQAQQLPQAEKLENFNQPISFNISMSLQKKTKPNVQDHKDQQKSIFQL